ncbi:DNA cytosine methyltransferase, partial [Pseudomonas aeruginosa]|nr:DNA cytosine methyltransferase [Pseudomonas aeruginosa]MBG4169934.1 DNA cytosine methyltransferase [Pseudomonas aeruginosa]MBG4490145.1 DNA cytosine methyltransferase [Pseudomonas aeruginosa]MBG4502527.1 DNA cytosine methyltransferase [Pseudomonas aeruginosa]
MLKRTLYHFHFCCGLGGGAAGFNRARPRVGNVEAHWECLGGIDVDPAGLRDFERLAGVPGTLLDLFTRDQYIRFHGTEPPAGWREATPEDIRRAAGG